MCLILVCSKTFQGFFSRHKNMLRQQICYIVFKNVILIWADYFKKPSDMEEGGSLVLHTLKLTEAAQPCCVRPTL